MAGFWHHFREFAVGFAIIMLAVLPGEQAYPQALPGALPDTPPEELEAAEEAEEIRYYSVELIVFEYSGSASGGNEEFVPEPQPYASDVVEGELPPGPDGIVNDDGVIEYGDLVDPPVQDVEIVEVPTLADVEFRILQPSDLTMTAIHERLEKIDAYKPILWGGWSQAATGEDTTPTIPLRVLGRLPLNHDGILTMYLKNYLHLVVDLNMQQQVAALQPVYRQEKPAYGPSGSNGNYELARSEYQTFIYRIQENRIFGSGQMRYFDHPKFGVLARIDRIEAPLEVPDDERDPEGRSMLGSVATD